MSTQVYPNIGSELGLNALSKEEFANIYEFVTDQANVPEEFKSTNIISITELVGAEDNADNRQVVFNIDESAISKTTEDGTYILSMAYTRKMQLRQLLLNIVNIRYMLLFLML